ncbi:MAG: hypothetical protein ABSA51_07530 [Anaerolineaceae bacterium]|jgi:hypothetical protein
MVEDKVLENFYRRKAARLGLAIHKSRSKEFHLDDFGDYMISDLENNAVIAGSKFELDIEAVKLFLNEYENNLLSKRKKSSTLKKLDN